MTTSENEKRPLPDGWTWTKLADACYIELGQSPPSSTYNTDGNGLPFFQGKAEFGNLYPTAVKWCSEPKKLAEAGDVLISVRAPVGSTNLNREKSCIGRGLAAIRPNDDMSNLYFLYLLRYIQQELVDQATGTTFQAISGKVLREQKIPLAPSEEQYRIVAEIEKQFTRLDQAVASLRRLQGSLARYKASVLKAACEGRLVPQDPTDEPADQLLTRILAERRARWQAANPGKKYQEPVGVEEDTAVLPDLPEGWVWTSLEQMSGLITSGSRGWSKYYADSGATFIRAQDINTDSLNLDSLAYVSLPDSAEGTRSRVDKNDLLITITGANVTKSALVRQNLDEAYVSQHVGLVKPVYGKTSEYLYYWIVSPTHGRAILGKDAYGAGKPGLNLGNLKELRIALPPLAEQERIVAEVERRLSVVTAVEQTITANLSRAERLRQSILHRAFTGQLVPQETN